MRPGKHISGFDLRKGCSGRRRDRLRLSLLLFFIFACQLSLFNAFSQTYPVTVHTLLMPPYSLRLSDYTQPGMQRLTVQAIVNDLNVSNLPVRLHIKMESAGITVETIPEIAVTPFFINGGGVHLFSGSNLSDYFNPDNLLFRGYSRDTYRRAGQLPDGFWKISVQVIHYGTGRALSNAGSAPAWIATGKPPQLRLPENGAELGQVQGIPPTFSWLPVNTGIPMTGGSVRYIFEMWELRIPGIDPYVAAVSMPAFYEAAVTGTSHVVQTSALAMEPGMRYAWRVTATDPAGLIPFEQGGHSEVRTFSYRSRCDSVREFSSTVQLQRGSFQWQPAPNHTSFNLEMHNPANGWRQTYQTFDSKTVWNDMDYGSEYRMRVQAVCSGGVSESDWTGWQTLRIPERRVRTDTECPDCVCEDVDTDTIVIRNFTLRDDLKAGDTIVNRSGRSRFILKSATPQGDGSYRGIFLFWLEIWNLKIICEYWNLRVNTDNVIIRMGYESVYDPTFVADVDKIAEKINEMADAVATLTKDTRIRDTLKIKRPIDDIYVNSDGMPVINGEEHDGGMMSKNTLITGTNGEEYVYTGDRQVMGKEEFLATGGNSRLLKQHNEEREAQSQPEVQFSASPQQVYGFDAYNGQKAGLQSGYPELKPGYRPAFKSIASFETDRVKADAGSGILFKDAMGIPPQKSGDELTVRGGAGGDEKALYAYRRDSDTTETVTGKLNVLSFDRQRKTVYLVPVNGAKLPDARELKNSLNRIYAQAVTEWTVETAPGIAVTFPGGQMTHGGSNAVSVYNADQKAVIKAFGTMEKDALYLFFVEQVKGRDGDIGGYMPLQRQAGFIYDLPNNELIAHELAHGAFNLRHTFSSEEFAAAQGTTDNLMDYKGNSELWRHQWKKIQDPERILLAFLEDEEEGEMSWTIIDKKHTKLFNHVYDNNHKGNLYYADLIAKHVTDPTISLTYNSNADKEWINEWRLNTTPENHIADIITKIRNTAKDSIIERMSLIEKGIYVGKHTVFDVEYPIAIYSKKSNIQNIAKIKVMNNEDLDKPESTVHLLRDETIQKYLVIAFFEGGETEPSLIVQVEKFDYSEWQNTMQIWLEYLGIIGEELPVLRIQLFNGNNPFPRDSILLIASDPQMPTIKVIPAGNDFPENDHVDMRLKLAYNRDGVDNNGNAIVLLRNDSTFYPATGWQTLSLNEEWQIDFGNDICGGTAYLFYQHGDRTDTLIFYIRGINPTETQIRNYLTQQGYTYWFFMKLARQESSLRQFGNTGNYTTRRQTGNSNRLGEPLYGPPRGFGLKQLDNWGMPARHATSQHLWNWQANIDGGAEVIREKESVMNGIRNRQNSIITRWNRDNPDDVVSDSLQIEAGAGMGTTVIDITEGTETFAVNPINNQRNIYDAVWIKLFNGGNADYYYHKIIVPDNTNEHPEYQKPYRVINRTNILGRNYVQDVCNRPN